MAYGQTAESNEPSTSLMNDSAHIIDRLNEVHGRLIKLVNTLHGSLPRDASAKPPSAEPEPTLRRNLDKISNAIADIEVELSRVEKRL
jgi:hypothetical protein